MDTRSKFSNLPESVYEIFPSASCYNDSINAARLTCARTSVRKDRCSIPMRSGELPTSFERDHLDRVGRATRDAKN